MTTATRAIHTHRCIYKRVVGSTSRGTALLHTVFIQHGVSRANLLIPEASTGEYLFASIAPICNTKTEHTDRYHGQPLCPSPTYHPPSTSPAAQVTQQALCATVLAYPHARLLYHPALCILAALNHFPLLSVHLLAGIKEYVSPGRLPHSGRSHRADRAAACSERGNVLIAGGEMQCNIVSLTHSLDHMDSVSANLTVKQARRADRRCHARRGERRQRIDAWTQGLSCMHVHGKQARQASKTTTTTSTVRSVGASACEQSARSMHMRRGCEL